MPSLKRLDKYSRDGIDSMEKLFTTPNTSDHEVGGALRYLMENVSYLEGSKEHLVGNILMLDWPYRTSHVGNCFCHFLTNLVSAYPIYLKAALRSLVILLIPRAGPSDSLTNPSKPFRHVVSQRSARVHMLIQELQKMVPLCNSTLLELLQSEAPFRTSEPFVIESYFENCLLLAGYTTFLRLDIIKLLVDHMVMYDVRIFRDDLIREEDHGSESEGEGEEVMDGVREKSRDLSVVPENTDEHRLDGLMQQGFQFIHTFCTTHPTADDSHESSSTGSAGNPAGSAVGGLVGPATGEETVIAKTGTGKVTEETTTGTLNWERTKVLYRELLLVFEQKIMATHACSHAQFLLFRICSYRKELVEGFLDFLWHRVKSPNTPALFRKVCAGYMASFVSRAEFVQVQTVTGVLAVLVPWIHEYIASCSTSFAVTDMIHHGPFYAACQAVFYIFIYRHQDLMDMPSGLNFCEKMNLPHIVGCRLNPLRVCLPNIAHTFADLARRYELAYCYVIMEKNKKTDIPILSADGKLVDMGTLLDAFFPFDPYLLKRSSSFLTGLYRTFSGIVHEEEDKGLAEQEEESFLDDSDDDDDGGADDSFCPTRLGAACSSALQIPSSVSSSQHRSQHRDGGDNSFSDFIMASPGLLAVPSSFGRTAAASPPEDISFGR